MSTTNHPTRLLPAVISSALGVGMCAVLQLFFNPVAYANPDSDAAPVAPTETATNPPVDAGKSDEKPAEKPKGAKLYSAHCASCHMGSGMGISKVFPPLAGSSWVVGDSATLARIVLLGATGPIDVNGTTYNSVMPGFANLNDEDLSLILTHIRSSWGHKASAVSAAEIRAERARLKDRKTPWQEAEHKAAKK